MNTGRIAINQAMWALRVYWGPAAWLALAGTLALAIVLPVLAGATGLAPIPLRSADFGIEWTTLAVTPAAAQQHAMRDLEGLLVNLALAVLLVAAISIVALSVTRAASRGHETSVRRALGGTRRDITSAALVEGIVLFGIVLVLAVPIGIVGAALARAAWPGAAQPGALAPIVIAIGGIGGVIVGGALFSVMPSAARQRMITRSATPHRLVVPAMQLGISLSVLMAASKMGSAADAIMTSSPVVSADALVYEITSLLTNPEERGARYAAILDRLDADSSLDAVSLTSSGIVAGLGVEDLVLTDCGRCFEGGLPRPIHAPRATLYAVSPDTFRAVGWPVVAGRGFMRVDDWRASRVAMVNEWLAARHFENGQAVGRMVHLGRNGWYTIVGVVRDKHGGALGSGLLSRAAVYVSSLQQPPDVAELLVRPVHGHRVSGVTDRIRKELGASASATLAGTASSLVTAQARPVRYFRGLIQLEGYTALAIALLGTIAIMRLWVQRALPELAIHRAVGATRSAVLWFVLARAGAVAAGGALMGLWLNIMVSGLLDSVFGGLPASELQAVIGLVSGLAGAALLTALYPAWVASRSDPSTWLEPDNN